MPSWSTSVHDPFPSVELWSPPLETHVYLHAFLSAADQRFAAPYGDIRAAVASQLQDIQQRRRAGQQPSNEISDSRIRTWKTAFEQLGLLTVRNGALHLTPLGQKLKQLYATVNDRIEGANDQIVKLGTQILNRQLLRNPLSSATLPEDADIRPYRAIWSAMRRLDNKLHWEELNRVMMHILRESELEPAIERIRTMRPRYGNYTNETLQLLGPPAAGENAETQRRLIPWFSRAGLGGLLISAANDSLGFRHLNDRFLPLVDEALSEPVAPIPLKALTDGQAYIDYLAEARPQAESRENTVPPNRVEELGHALLAFGTHKIVALTGLPGAGKSTIARAVVERVTASDPYRFAEVQFHPGTSYEDFIEGFMPRPDGTGFELRSKTLRIFNRRARLDPDGAPYIILIEELNRADVQAVLGELLTYIEHRERSFRFAISGDEDRLAPNLFFLATLNPFDRSARPIDNAVMRRIHRIPISYSADEVKAALHRSLEPLVAERLGLWFDMYHSTLPFGPAEFYRAHNVADLSAIWQGTLLPFLQDVNGEVRPHYQAAANAFPWKQ